MKVYEIGVIVGSLRKESFNKQMAVALAKLAPADFAFKHIQIGDLPLYPSLSNQKKMPLKSSK